MSYMDKPEYNKYASLQSGNMIQPNGLFPVVSQGCKSTTSSRFATSYIPNCKMNNQYRTILAQKMGYNPQYPNDYGQTPSNRQYRQFLQDNGVAIMEMNRGAAEFQAGSHCPANPIADMLYTRNDYPNFKQ